MWWMWRHGYRATGWLEMESRQPGAGICRACYGQPPSVKGNALVAAFAGHSSPITHCSCPRDLILAAETLLVLYIGSTFITRPAHGSFSATHRQSTEDARPCRRRR